MVWLAFLARHRPVSTIGEPGLHEHDQEAADQRPAEVIGVNFIWTLVSGFLVMFMQAGFRHRRNGPVPREERQPHHDDELHGVWRRHAGLLADRLFASRRRRRRDREPRRDAPPQLTSSSMHLFGKDWGLFGNTGHLLMHRGTYDVGVMVMFLFQMVFMDTALTIVTGTAARALEVFGVHRLVVLPGRVHLSALRQLGVGRRLARDARRELRPRPRLRRLRRLGRRALGRAASPRWRWRIIIGPRIGKFTRDGKPNAIPGHDIMMVLLGCFILAFGWFGFNPGSTLGAVRQRQPAHQLGRRQHDAGRHGRLLRRHVLHVDPLRETGRVDDAATASSRAWWPSPRPAAS